MKAVVLAAGYATRLGSLTDTTAKPLLPVGGRPMLDYLYDQLVDSCAVSEVHLVTNRKFAGDFTRWAGGCRRPLAVHVHDDGTATPADRLGAIGDLAFVLERTAMEDDLLVVAGDNLFDYPLREFAGFFASRREASAVAVHECASLELVARYSSVELDARGRVVSFVEKPRSPRTRLAGTATYLFHRDHVPLVQRYLEEGGAPDQPGRFLEWLHTRVPVFGYRTTGLWLDIGDRAELRRADLVFRARRGLPAHSEYAGDEEPRP